MPRHGDGPHNQVDLIYCGLVLHTRRKFMMSDTKITGKNQVQHPFEGLEVGGIGAARRLYEKRVADVLSGFLTGAKYPTSIMGRIEVL